MRMDVHQLQAFYGQDAGQWMARVIAHKLRKLHTPLGTDENILLFGYGIPYLEVFQHQPPSRIMVAMPAPQGAARWPPCPAPSCTILSQENQWPFPDRSWNGILLIHSFEFLQHPEATLREAWRTLTAAGKLILVVPNWISPWSHLQTTPFGRGRAYSPSQLTAFLRDSMFSVQEKTGALFLPHTALTHTVEEWGQEWCPWGGGVSIICAIKNGYSPISPRCTSKHWRPVFLPV